MGIRQRAAILLVFGLCTTFAAAACAQSGAASDPHTQLESLKKYGTAHKACDGWSDGCALCARRPDGTLGCSRLGVDCEVTDIVCTQLARDPKTGKTPPPDEP